MDQIGKCLQMRRNKGRRFTGHQVRAQLRRRFLKATDFPLEGLHLHHVCGHGWCTNLNHLVPLQPELHDMVHYAKGRAVSATVDGTVSHASLWYRQQAFLRALFPEKVPSRVNTDPIPFAEMQRRIDKVVDLLTRASKK